MIEQTRPRNSGRHRILYIQYTNPAGYPPLEHSSRLLARAGWQVLFLGTSALGANDLRFPPHGNIRVLQMPFCLPGWRQKLHYLLFCAMIGIWTLHWRPRFVYASDLLATPTALVLSYFPGLQMIYHEHDSPGGLSNGIFMRMCLAARRRLAHKAAICILPNQQRIARFVAEVGIQNKTICVWNCPTRDEIAAPRKPLDGDSLWVLYHGSIVPSRLPPAVLDALTMLPDRVKLRIIGYETIGHRGYIRELQTLARRLGVINRIDFVDALPRHKLLELCRKSDVGLALLPNSNRDPNIQNMTGASNKAFDYLASGLAVLVSDQPDWRKIYAEPGYATVCNPDDSKSIADALRWFLEHPVETRNMGERGRQRILQEWNYERQFSPVLDRLNGALS